MHLTDSATSLRPAPRRLRRHRPKLPDPIVQLIRERFFCDQHLLRDIRDELHGLGYENEDLAGIWRIARGFTYKKVPHTPRLLQFLADTCS